MLLIAIAVPAQRSLLTVVQVHSVLELESVQSVLFTQSCSMLVNSEHVAAVKYYFYSIHHNRVSKVCSVQLLQSTAASIVCVSMC
jgi:hypothetical protein